MKAHANVELVLREYLGDDGSAAPDYVLDVVADRIARQAQKRPWPLPWRPSVTTQMRVAAAITAGVFLAVAGWSVLPKQPQIGQPTPSPFDSLRPISSPSASAPPQASPPAPTFESAVFDVPFQVTLAGGWHPPVEGFDTPTAVTINQGALNVTFWSIAETRVRPPGTTATDYDHMAPWPADVHAWLQTLPYCTVEDAQAATIGGRPALIHAYRCTGIPNEPNVEKQGAQTFIFSNRNGPYLNYATGAVVNRIIEIRTAPNAGIAVIYSGAASGSVPDAVNALLATMTFD